MNKLFSCGQFTPSPPPQKKKRRSSFFVLCSRDYFVYGLQWLYDKGCTESTCCCEFCKHHKKINIYLMRTHACFLAGRRHHRQALHSCQVCRRPGPCRGSRSPHRSPQSAGHLPHLKGLNTPTREMATLYFRPSLLRVGVHGQPLSLYLPPPLE